MNNTTKKISWKLAHRATTTADSAADFITALQQADYKALAGYGMSRSGSVYPITGHYINGLGIIREPRDDKERAYLYQNESTKAATGDTLETEEISAFILPLQPNGLADYDNGFLLAARVQTLGGRFSTASYAVITKEGKPLPARIQVELDNALEVNFEEAR